MSEYAGKEMDINDLQQFKGRGVQESDVFAAADALLAERKRPTIERVRQKIGRGSPNTVSPMLERWFATLGERLVGGTPGTDPSARGEPDGLPLGVRNVAQLLWETAQREAESVQRAALDAAREAQDLREAALAQAQEALIQREEAFAQARIGLDAALASSQQARENLERQLREQISETQRARSTLDSEARRLNALLAQAADTQERLRLEHAGALATHDADLRQAQERHASHERRMLAEVDRARQTAKALEGDLAKEQMRRAKNDEAATLRQAADAEKLQQLRAAWAREQAELNERLTAQSVQVIQLQAQLDALRLQLQAQQEQCEQERVAHEATRELLSEAIQAEKRRQRTASRRPKRANKDNDAAHKAPKQPPTHE